jgi:hypothetical protein
MTGLDYPNESICSLQSCTYSTDFLATKPGPIRYTCAQLKTAWGVEPGPKQNDFYRSPAKRHRRYRSEGFDKSHTQLSKPTDERDPIYTWSLNVVQKCVDNDDGFCPARVEIDELCRSGDFN